MIWVVDVVAVEAVRQGDPGFEDAILGTKIAMPSGNPLNIKNR